MVTKTKGQPKMTAPTPTPTTAPAEQAATVDQVTPVTTENVSTTTTTNSTDTTPVVTTVQSEATEVTAPTPTQEPVKSGVVVTKTSSPAGQEASPAVKAAVAAQTTAVTNNQSAFEKHLAKVMDSGTGREKSAVNALRTYVEQMKPGKPISAEDGAKLQANLFRLFQNITKHDDSFKESMDIFIAFFKEYKDTVFHERYVYRFMENLTLASGQINAFTAMINMIKIAASSGKTSVKKHVDINRSLNESYQEDQRQRVINYFN